MSSAQLTANEKILAAAEADVLLRAEDVGVTGVAMSKARGKGILQRVIPGVYLGTEHSLHPLAQAAAWTYKHPQAVACMLTAAAHHGLIDTPPEGAWLIVRKGTSPPRSSVVAVHVIQSGPRHMDPAHDADHDIGTTEVHGVTLRITGRDRTVLDLFRYVGRVDANQATEILRRRVHAPDFDLSGFAAFATRLDIWPTVAAAMQELE